MAAGSGPPRRVVPPWRSGRMKNPLKLGMLGMLGIGSLGSLTFADVPLELSTTHLFQINATDISSGETKYCNVAIW